MYMYLSVSCLAHADLGEPAAHAFCAAFGARFCGSAFGALVGRCQRCLQRLVLGQCHLFGIGFGRCLALGHLGRPQLVDELIESGHDVCACGRFGQELSAVAPGSGLQVAEGPQATAPPIILGTWRAVWEWRRLAQDPQVSEHGLRGLVAAAELVWQRVSVEDLPCI